MFKPISTIAAAVALLVPAVSVAAPLGPDAAACKAGSKRPAFLVSVSGFKNRLGTLRVQLYGSNPSDFLAAGKKLRRIDLPVTRAGPMNVCVAAPKAGTYAVAVRHDADNDGRTGWNDGGGFSNNPAVSLISPKPSHSSAAVVVGNGVKTVRVTLNYRSGGSIGPVG